MRAVVHVQDRVRRLCALALGVLAVAGGAAAVQAADTTETTIHIKPPLTIAEIQTMLDAEGAHDPFVPEAPLGILIDEDLNIPEDNPITAAKVELGRQLYFDPRLSRDSTVSCATCHHLDKGWTDRAPVSTGIDGQKGGRSAPTVLNRILGGTQFWDGRAGSLEEQALGPIENPIEMGFTHDEAVERINGIPGYTMQFERVFGGPATADRIAKAIASFERTVLTGAAPNDFYSQAEPLLNTEPDPNATEEEMLRRSEILAEWEANRMSESALRGRKLFFDQARCSRCHVGQDFTDEIFHNIGVGMDQPAPDIGREKVTGKEEDRGKFKTPGLRNIADTAPYMHDGSQATLEEVVIFYNQGGHPNPWLDKEIVPLDLSDQDIADLVAYMEEGLQGQVTKVETPRLPE